MKSLLILVHPDAVVERGTSTAIKYLELLKTELPKFDIVITHLFLSERYDGPEELAVIFREIREFLETKSTKCIKDSTMGRNSFENVIFDIMAEHESDGLNIFMSGGNQDLCLQDSHDNFCEILGQLVSSNNKMRYRIYTPLIYRREYQDKWNSEKNNWDIYIEPGVGSRLPAGRARDYPGQNFYSQERFTDTDYWFKEIETDNLDEIISKLQSLSDMLLKLSKNNESKVIKGIISSMTL